MAKEEKEMRDVYWVSLKERNERGVRTTLEKKVFEGMGGALKQYNDWVLEYESVKGKQLIVDVIFIKEGCFYTIREFHLYERREC